MEYYFHGTDQLYSDGLDKMIKIIESGGIKSMNERGENTPGLYNGDDYISVGKWDKDISNDSNSCFYGWIFWCPTFIIDSNINAIHADNRDGLSCFVDEYHVKDKIGLDKIRGIALPFTLIERNKEYLLKTLKLLKYAQEYKWNVYESDMFLIDRINKEEVFDDMNFNK